MGDRRNPALGVAALVLFALTVLAANAALDQWGFFTVLGLSAPWAALFAGLSFQLRDVGQEHTGWQYTLLAIAAGTILSAAVDWHLAVASGCAFLISETCDLGVYTPLRERGWVRAVALSGLVGAIIDSTLFLWLAEAAIPGPTFTLKAVAGLTLAKLAVVAATTAAAARYRRQLAPALA